LTTVPATLTRNQLYWSTIQRQNLATLTTTVRNTALAGLTYGLTTRQQNPGHNELNKNISQIIKPNNMNATKDDFATATGRLIMKIKVSDTDTASIYNFDSTIVRRTIISGESVWLTNFPDFPEAGGVIDGFDLTYRHGDVVGDFDNVYLWDRALQNSIGITANGAPAVSKATGLSNALNRSIDNYANLGFFSGTEFNVNALAAQGFGSNAVREISAAQNLTNSSQVNANSVPFRILFFDNYATNNGLYIISGKADYAEGLLTAININGDHYGTLLPKSTISTTSSWGGKHTIVKVKGGKSDLIELSDINFI